ncbi:hypothetical protein CC2G_004344 [Coprinopsis cinerea AmutBmut pab1-1]|nr:hypothetical protein CC2G_004344 [Coprinopsis cinerea AmutBmut pab1-1]
MSSADREYIEFYALSTAATMFANGSIALLAAGMQIFMFIYGLSTFLSTLPSLRKGRLRYIIVSGTILILSVTGTGLDLYVTFKQLYYSGLGIEFIRYK